MWAGAKPRTRFKMLQLDYGQGGLSLPNLRQYYYAAQLKYRVSWCSPKVVARWKEIEMVLSGTPPPQAQLGPKIPKPINKKYNIAQFTLQIWHKVVKRYNLMEDVNILIWPFSAPWFQTR